MPGRGHFDRLTFVTALLFADCTAVCGSAGRDILAGLSMDEAFLACDSFRGLSDLP
jgi:hypothetical protein